MKNPLGLAPGAGSLFWTSIDLTKARSDFTAYSGWNTPAARFFCTLFQVKTWPFIAT